MQCAFSFTRSCVRILDELLIRQPSGLPLQPSQKYEPAIQIVFPWFCVGFTCQHGCDVLVYNCFGEASLQEVHLFFWLCQNSNLTSLLRNHGPPRKIIALLLNLESFYNFSSAAAAGLGEFAGGEAGDAAGCCPGNGCRPGWK